MIVGPAGLGPGYTAVAIGLHWLIALALLGMVGMGLLMTHAKLAPLTQFKLYQLHKSVGITVLVLALVRLAWRWVHRPPPLPADLPGLEKRAAAASHLALYGLMIGLPLVGWALVSASRLNIPTLLYGVIRWPHLPILSTLPNKAPVEAALKLVHAWGAYLLIAVVVVHGAAALRHHFWIGDDVLRRMVPGLPRFGPARART